MALAISQAENGTRKCSRDNAGLNRDGSVDYGIFMINGYWHRHQATPAQLKDCLINIKVAKAIYDKQGWTPWVVYNTGSYKKFLR